MATAEGGDQDYTVIPATQPTQGKYNQDLLEGLDFFLNELKKEIWMLFFILPTTGNGAAEWQNIWNGMAMEKFQTRT